MGVRALVTGGAGFIGSALVRKLVARGAELVVNVDKLTYAANVDSLRAVSTHPRYHFERVDICDGAALERIFREHEPTVGLNLAAECHVDGWVGERGGFFHRNVTGRFSRLEEGRGQGMRVRTVAGRTF